MPRSDWGIEIPGGFFDEERHIYRDESGIPVLSSTQVFDALDCTDFSMVKPEVMEWKRVFGSAIHTGVEYLVAEDLDWDTLDEAILPAVTGVNGWLKKVEFVSEAVEERRVHSFCGMKYGMTLDHRGTMMFQGKRWRVIADLKTGSRFSKTWDWQLGSYIAPQEKGAWIGVILQVDPDGTVTPYYLKDVEAAKREFQILLAAATLKVNAGLAKIGK